MLDLTSLLAPGKTPEAVSMLDPNFRASLAAFLEAAPPGVRENIRIGSGYRTNDRQAELWQQALAKYGSPEAARKWVAPPGRSQHNHGMAVDLSYGNPEATAWAQANAGAYGLNFPLTNENWHIEPAGSRGAPTNAPVMADVPATAPMPPSDTGIPATTDSGLGTVLAGVATALQPRSVQTEPRKPGGPFQTALAAEDMAKRRRAGLGGVDFIQFATG